MYYENFEKLCNEYNVTPYRVAKETGYTTAMFSQWKHGTTTPKIQTLEKIASFFKVPVSALTGSVEEVLIKKEELIEEAFNENPQMRLLFSLVKDAPPEDIEYVIKKLQLLKENQ